jgi:hypothetical protein
LQTVAVRSLAKSITIEQNPIKFVHRNRRPELNTLVAVAQRKIGVLLLVNLKF